MLFISRRFHFLTLSILFFALIHFIASSYDENNYNMPLSIIDAFYFSAVSQTSTGFGDIIPTTDLTKIITICQMLFSLIIAFGLPQ